MLNLMVPTLSKTRVIIKYYNHNILYMTMAKKHTTRWAFSASKWLPTEKEISLASSCIQNDEKDRISKFVFQNDAKSSLIGRLMMRKFVHIATARPYEEIRFDRDSHGKPVLSDGVPYKVSFNVSHQGDYVVLAGEQGTDVGIDVMKVEPPVNKNIPEFFRIMHKQFSDQEWATIKSFSSEAEQIATFYRLWCLKESYVKNIGVGITVKLSDISFEIKTLSLTVGEICSDTVLYIKNVKLEGWTFEETLLDEQHAVAVAVKMDRLSWQPTSYTLLSFDDLVKEAKPFTTAEDSFTSNFLKKEMKLF